MSGKLESTEKLIRMVPEDKLTFVNEFLKKVIKSWDPDFTKVTASERRDIDLAETEYEKGETFSDDEVW